MTHNPISKIEIWVLPNATCVADGPFPATQLGEVLRSGSTRAAALPQGPG